MTIYEKLAEARVQFQDRGPKMSGKNSFAGYAYFELGDILPTINKIGKELGFICLVSFSENLATLTVSDVDGDGAIVFSSPMSTANLKGCHEVQNLGAVETYIKRYLYQNAFEIVEADAVNGTHNPNEKPEAKSEYVSLKESLIDYINAGMFDHPDNVNAVIAKKDIAGMKKALAVAKEKEKKAQEAVQ